MGAVWQDPGTWVALGVSILFVVVGLVMHRVFVNILRSGPTDRQESSGE